MSDLKSKFIDMMLQKHQNASQQHYYILTKEMYDNLIQEVLDSKTAKVMTTLQIRRVKRFNVIEVDGIQKLIANSWNNEIRYYLTIDEVYDEIKSAHLAIGHGGRDRLIHEMSKKFANVTRDMINLFLSLCECYRLKRVNKKKGIVTEQNSYSPMDSRCKVDLIDMVSRCDRDKKFIMVYQDHLTKFIILRALREKTEIEVAYNLIDIFTTFGAPCILHSDSGRKFIMTIIKELTQLWPNLKMVPGKPCHSQNQGSVERTSQDIENMIATWMKDNNTEKWSDGLPFVQFMKNIELNSSIKMSPYKAMFGKEPEIGLTAISVPNEVSIETEDDLENILRNLEQNDKNSDEELEAENIDEKIVWSNVQHELVTTRKKQAPSLQNQAKRMKQINNLSYVEDNVTFTMPKYV